MIDIFGAIKRIFIQCFEIFAVPFRFLQNSWRDTGRGRGLLIGLPAVLVTLTATALLLHSSITAQSNTKERYQSIINDIGGSDASRESEIKEKRDQFLKATTPEGKIEAIHEIIDLMEKREFYYRRLVSMEDASTETRYDLLHAINLRIGWNKELIAWKQRLDKDYINSEEYKSAMQAIGFENQKLDMMILQMAPEDSRGYGAAHLLMAKRRIAQIGESRQKAQTILSAQKHLQHALEDKPRNSEIKQLLAEIYVLTANYENAVPLLQSIIGERPHTYRTLATCYQRMKTPEKLDKLYSSTADIFLDRIKTQPDSIPHWHGLIECLSLSKQFDKAEQLLELRIKNADRTIVRNHAKAMLLGFYVVWIDHLINGKEADRYTKARAIIEKSQALSDNDQRILARLTLVALSKSDQAEWAKGEYDALVDDNRSFVVLSAIIKSAMENDDKTTAVKYLKEQIRKSTDAHKKSFLYAMALNNLAYLQMELGGDPNESMDLIKEAMANPQIKNPRYASTHQNIIHTKARAHMKLKEYDDAIALFNRIKPLRKEEPEFLELLIECHQKSKLPEQSTIETLQAELEKVKEKIRQKNLEDN